jgi:hypothetical protein
MARVRFSPGIEVNFHLRHLGTTIIRWTKILEIGESSEEDCQEGIQRVCFWGEESHAEKN